MDEAPQETQEESLLECTHGLVNTCSYSYITKYKPSNQEKCSKVFSKRCQTVFTREAESVIVEHCYQPVSRSGFTCILRFSNLFFKKMFGQPSIRVRHRDGRNILQSIIVEFSQKSVASTRVFQVMFETDCRTTYSTAGPGQPFTLCKRLPRTLCGGTNCDFVREEEQCHNKTVEHVKEVPRESCDIVPSSVCQVRDNRFCTLILY